MRMRKEISRRRLEGAVAALTNPTVTTPPPRRLDAEIYKIFYPVRTKEVGGDFFVVRRDERQFPDSFWREGLPCAEGFLEDDTPALDRIPNYVGSCEAAHGLMGTILGLRDTALIRELRDDFLPLWDVELISEADTVTGRGRSYDLGAAIVIALFTRLLDDGLRPPGGLSVTA